ncbi:MAG: hypothetical protein KOO60_01685, partial [Gemmatimonadales bacterium]|nr:hypothetical protein [Gemmatimonadales bacterium]
QEVSEDNISDPPRIGGTVDSDFILGMGKADDNTIILLNLEKILIGGEMQALQDVMGEISQPV